MMELKLDDFCPDEAVITFSTPSSGTAPMAGSYILPMEDFLGATDVQFTSPGPSPSQENICRHMPATESTKSQCTLLVTCKNAASADFSRQCKILFVAFFAPMLPVSPFLCGAL